MSRPALSEPGAPLALTEAETLLVRAMLRATDCVGHEYGYVEGLRGLAAGRALAGLMGSLSKKGVVTVGRTRKKGTLFLWGPNALAAARQAGWLNPPAADPS